MNKSTSRDCLSFQNSYKMSGPDLVKDGKLLCGSKCTSCRVPHPFGSL